MNWLKQLFSRRRRFHDLSEEIRVHIDERIEELVAGGMSPKDAMAAARREFGNPTLIEEDSREVWRWPTFEDLFMDVRFGLRMLRKNLGPTAAVVVALALGIGLNTTVFHFVNALLLRPPARVQAPDKLLELWLHNRSASGIEGYLPLTYPDYLYYRDHNQSFSGMLAFDGDPHPLIWNKSGEGQIVMGQLVSGNFFSLLGVDPALGRSLLDDDDRAANPQPVVVLGHSFWQQHLGSDPNVVGKTLLLNGTNFSVVGVAPAGFAGLLAAVEPDVWAPITMIEQVIHDKGRLSNRQGYWLIVAGRLQTGANARTAVAEVEVLARQIEADHPESNKNLDAQLFPATLVPGPYRGYVSAFTAVLMSVFVLVLLLACANAAGFLLARATGRAREMAMRSVLGASRARLIRQMLVESALLSGLAGCAGLVLARWAAPLLMELKPASLPLTLRIPLDWRVILFTCSVSVATGIAFGLTPALRSAKVQVAPILKDEGPSGGYRKSRLRSLLMIGEIATCFVLLVGATLCVRSLLNANSIDPGFDTQHVAVAALDPVSMGYPESGVRDFYERLSEKIGALPGVTSLSFVNHLPLGSGIEQTSASEGVLPSADQRIDGVPVDVLRVAPEYFKTMGIPILGGRDFERQESATGAPVVLINEAMARRMWPNQNSVGKWITLGSGPEKTEIIGVVKTGKYRTLGEDPTPLIYSPRLPGRRTLVVRSSGDPAGILAAIRHEIHAVDANIAATDLETLQQYMALPLFPARTTGLLLGASGIVALVLTCIGLFGVISYIVSQRTHEIGVRMALGARRADVLKLVIGHGLAVSSVGLILGLGAAFGATRFLASLLYGIGPTDAVTLISVSLGLTLVALLACYIPAVRATRVDPMVALRHE